MIPSESREAEKALELLVDRASAGPFPRRKALSRLPGLVLDGEDGVYPILGGSLPILIRIVPPKLKYSQ